MRFDATGPLFRALGVDLTEVEGIDVGTALVILAEIGVDVSRFPTEKHFASWLGVCPRLDRSNKTTCLWNLLALSASLSNWRNLQAFIRLWLNLPLENRMNWARHTGTLQG